MNMTNKNQKRREAAQRKKLAAAAAVPSIDHAEKQHRADNPAENNATNGIPVVSQDPGSPTQGTTTTAQLNPTVDSHPPVAHQVSSAGLKLPTEVNIPFPLQLVKKGGGLNWAAGLKRMAARGKAIIAVSHFNT
jgi:hypothetical protein